MNAISVMRTEGGNWIIKFANGCIWDTVNGWHKNVRVRVNMGREKALT